MQNKFGLKDFVLLVVMLAVGVSVWLGMAQRDRLWDKVDAVNNKLPELEQQLSRIETRLESGVVTPAPGLAAAATGSTGSPANPPRASARDESWARPGVPIQWQTPYTYTTDPRPQPEFSMSGDFTEIYEAQPAKVVPSIQTDVYGRRVVDLVMESLATYDPKTLRLRGQLADAWQVDPKGLWLRAHIRDSARFSDGSPVTAEDLRWSFHDFIMNPQIEAQRDRSTLSDTMEKIEVVSERVVDFTFKQVNFLNVDNALGLFIMPKHFYSKFSPADLNKSTGLLMGSGPYKFESVDAANQWAPPAPVILVRNEQYWGPKPPLARIRLKAINEELGRLTEYKNGDADMITPSAPQFVTLKGDKEFAANNQLDTWINMRSGKGGIAWNCGPRNGKLTPFHDPKVRIAMTMLLDREKMIRDIWKGMGIVAASFFNPGTPQHDDTLKPWPYDVAKAKALLKEAGWEDKGDGVMRDRDGNPFVFELTYPTGGEIAERLATYVKDSYAAAGIKCTLRGMDWSVMDPVRDQRDFDSLFMGWGANAPESDPKQIFHSSSIKDQGDNFAQWSSPRADAVIDAARTEMDADKRSKLWHDFEQVMHEEEPWTWVRVTPYTRIIKPEIGNVQMYAKGIEYYELYRAGRALPVKPQQVARHLMGTYIARRLLLMIPTLVGITFLVFMLVALAPGGIGAGLRVQGGAMQSQKGVALQRAYLEDRYGLDDPVVVQYGRWLGRISPIKFGERAQIDPSGNRVNGPKPIKDPPLWKWFADRLPQPQAGEALTGLSGEALVNRYRELDRAYGDARSEYVAATTLFKQAIAEYARVVGWEGALDAKGEARVAWLAGREPDRAAPAWRALAAAWEQEMLAYSAAGAARERLVAGFSAHPYPEAGAAVIPGVVSVALPDFGYAYSTGRPVWDLVATALPVTILLDLIAVPIIYLIAIPSGMMAATFRGSWLDAGLGALYIALYSIPTVLAGVFCIGFLASRDYLGMFPVSGLHANSADAMRFLPGSGAGGWQWGYLGDLFWHVALPVLCLTYGGFAVLSKQTRAAMLDNFSADYVRTAKAKGVAMKDVVLKHVFRNSLLPLITIFVTIFPAMLSGSVVIEKIFTIPGMGSLTFSAINLRDRELLLASTLMIAGVNLLGLLVADVLYALADPRVTFE